MAPAVMLMLLDSFIAAPMCQAWPVAGNGVELRPGLTISEDEAQERMASAVQLRQRLDAIDGELVELRSLIETLH